MKKRTTDYLELQGRYDTAQPEYAELAGTMCCKVYDRTLRADAQLPILVVEATPTARTVVCYTGGNGYYALACPLGAPGSHYIRTQTENAGNTMMYDTWKKDGVLHRVRRRPNN